MISVMEFCTCLSLQEKNVPMAVTSDFPICFGTVTCRSVPLYLVIISVPSSRFLVDQIFLALRPKAHLSLCPSSSVLPVPMLP